MTNDSIDREIKKAKELKQIYVPDTHWVFRVIIDILEAMKSDEKPGTIQIDRKVAEDWIDGKSCSTPSLYVEIRKALVAK